MSSARSRRRSFATTSSLLPTGKVLDIAMAEGRNAVFLAKKGYQVEGVDYSEVALRKAKLLARENRVEVGTINADLTTYQIKPDTYDVILNIDYLQRSLIAGIKKGLHKGGVVVFENDTVDQLKNTQEHDSARRAARTRASSRSSSRTSRSSSTARPTTARKRRPV